MDAVMIDPVIGAAQPQFWQISGESICQNCPVYREKARKMTKK
jgi:hypothetical protein